MRALDLVVYETEKRARTKTRLPPKRETNDDEWWSFLRVVVGGQRWLANQVRDFPS